MFSRERQTKRFKSPGHAQRFLSAHDGISNLVPLRRPRLPAAQYQAARTQAFQTWAEVTGITAQAQPSMRPVCPADLIAPMADQVDSAHCLPFVRRRNRHSPGRPNKRQQRRQRAQIGYGMRRAAQRPAAGRIGHPDRDLLRPSGTVIDKAAARHRASRPLGHLVNAHHPPSPGMRSVGPLSTIERGNAVGVLLSSSTTPFGVIQRSIS